MTKSVSISSVCHNYFIVAGNLFSDPNQQKVDHEDDLPENLSDDNDDAKLTTN